MKRLAILGVAVLALSGCSAPAGESSYGSIDQLKDAYEGAGGVCSTWEPGHAIGPWAEYGNCGAYGAEDGATLSTYTNAADLKEAVDGTKERSKTAAFSTLLVGENWIVQSNSAADLAGALGGTVVKLG